MDKIRLQNGNSFNFSGRYYPTSFGNQIGLELYYQTPQFNIFIAPHINQNETHNFIGIEALLFEKPIKIANQKFLTISRIIADLQPQNQAFKTDKAAFTGLISEQITWKVGKYIYPFLSIEAKNKGWIAGNAFLDEKFSIKMGLSTRFDY
jgi:hypothetical protein